MGDLLSALGVELTASARGGLQLRADNVDWLRAVLVTLGHRAHIEGQDLHVPTTDAESVERAVLAALAPEAILFDLDGVLADIARRTAIANVEDVQAIATHYAVGVVTTCPCRVAESVLERHGFLEFIGAVVGREDGPCKPDPFPVRCALQRLGKRSAWMLGDNPSDMKAARGASVVPLGILPRGIGAEAHMDRLRAAGAVRLVASVASLQELLPPRPGSVGP